MRLTDFKALTFDCYGTLIDWESGIWNAMQPLLTSGGLEIERDRALAVFAEHESSQQAATPGLLYPALLATVLFLACARITPADLERVSPRQVTSFYLARFGLLPLAGWALASLGRSRRGGPGADCRALGAA